MQPRIPNIAGTHPDTLRALLALSTAAQNDGVPPVTGYLLTLRASQINGCSVCVEMHSRELREAGESDERIFAVSSWRDAPYDSDAERAALALTEAATRMSDRSDPVPDEVWDEASRHYDEPRARLAGDLDRRDQRLEPDERDDESARRRLVLRHLLPPEQHETRQRLTQILRRDELAHTHQRPRGRSATRSCRAREPPEDRVAIRRVPFRVYRSEVRQKHEESVLAAGSGENVWQANGSCRGCRVGRSSGRSGSGVERDETALGTPRRGA